MALNTLALRRMGIENGFSLARQFARALGIEENRYTRYERAEVEPNLTLGAQGVARLSTTVTGARRPRIENTQKDWGWPAPRSVPPARCDPSQAIQTHPEGISR